MKRFIATVVSSVVLSTVIFSAIAKAETAPTRTITPFQLVNLAENGYLSNQGIPQGNDFINQNEQGHIQSQQLVQAAINQGRLPASALNNTDYLNGVNTELTAIQFSDRR
jgi:hypothetical protein